jgi:hypothetical protein
VERQGLGLTVAPGDADGFASACAELLDDPAPAAEAVRAAAPGMRWSRAVEPLIVYCLHHAERPVPRKDPAVVALTTYGQYPAIASHLKETKGAGEVARRAGRVVSRALRQLRPGR